MIDIIGQRKGKVLYPMSDEDAERVYDYPENKPLRLQITAATKIRSYRELCCYMGSCRYISSLNLNEDLNTKDKVDFLTRIKQGFVSDTVYDDTTKRVHWIPKSLSYANCNQPRSHRFIADALESHAELAGIKSVEEYVLFLNTMVK